MKKKYIIFICLMVFLFSGFDFDVDANLNEFVIPADEQNIQVSESVVFNVDVLNDLSATVKSIERVCQVAFICLFLLTVLLCVLLGSVFALSVLKFFMR